MVPTSTDSSSVSAGGDSAAVSAFERLLGVVQTLRDPGGCPWDREQTHASLRPHLLEECYELLQAIDADDSDGVREELGDLLVHVAFHADMARRAGQFDAAEVIYGAATKLIGRHPHVFGDGERLDSAEAVIERWDDLKRKEKGGVLSIADGVPAAMPALAFSSGLQHRAARAGVPWDSDRTGTVLSGDASRALEAAEGDEARERAAGELLFKLVAELADIGVDPEAALRATTLRFRDRLRRMETAAGSTPISKLGGDERTRLWREAGEPPGRSTGS